MNEHLEYDNPDSAIGASALVNGSTEPIALNAMNPGRGLCACVPDVS
jgi:hypothetical protein